jgi:hypothetical protein
MEQWVLENQKNAEENKLHVAQTQRSIQDLTAKLAVRGPKLATLAPNHIIRLPRLARSHIFTYLLRRQGWGLRAQGAPQQPAAFDWLVFCLVLFGFVCLGGCGEV